MICCLYFFRILCPTPVWKAQKADFVGSTQKTHIGGRIKSKTKQNMYGNFGEISLLFLHSLGLVSYNDDLPPGTSLGGPTAAIPPGCGLPPLQRGHVPP